MIIYVSTSTDRLQCQRPKDETSFEPVSLRIGYFVGVDKKLTRLLDQLASPFKGVLKDLFYTKQNVSMCIELDRYKMTGIDSHQHVTNSSTCIR